MVCMVLHTMVCMLLHTMVCMLLHTMVCMLLHTMNTMLSHLRADGVSHHWCLLSNGSLSSQSRHKGICGLTVIYLYLEYIFVGYCDEGILSSGDNIQVKLGRIMAMKAEGKNKVWSIAWREDWSKPRGREGAETHPLQKHTPRKWVKPRWRRRPWWPPGQWRTSSWWWRRRWRWSRWTELRIHLVVLSWDVQ